MFSENMGVKCHLGQNVRRRHSPAWEAHLHASHRKIMAEQVPCFRSLAFREIPTPDYADVCLAVLPDGASTEPAEWAERLFPLESMPRWVAAAMGLRQALVPLIGVPKAPRDTFRVTDQSARSKPSPR